MMKKTCVRSGSPIQWYVAVAIASILACSSHQKVSRRDAAPTDTSPTGGSIPESTGGIVATGGAVSTGGIVATGGAESTGGIVATGGIVKSGGVIATGGVATVPGQDAECDTVPLMQKIAAGAQGVRIPGGCVATPAGIDGTVVLDDTGKVTAITGTYYSNATATQATVDSLATVIWPCLGGQIIRYTCANPVIGP